jgi:hypothetical protein
MKPKMKRPPTLFEQRRGPDHHDLIQEITMARRVLSWTTALRDLQRDRAPGFSNAMYEASLARAREADARREAAQKRQKEKTFGRCDAATAFLLAVRHNRLSLQSDPDQRALYLERARHWLSQARTTRRAEGSRLP